VNPISELDLAIVDALQVNPRASWAVIGETLEVAPLTVSRRWSALTKRGLAWTEATMGPEAFRGLFLEIRCHGPQLQSTIEALHALPQVITVGRLLGDSDLYAIAVAPDDDALQDLVNRYVDQLDVKRVRAHVFTEVYGGPTWRLKVLNERQADALRGDAQRPIRPAPVSESDRALFSLLNQDGRASFADLSRKLDVPAHNVRASIERMRRRGLMTFRADVARPLAGWPTAALVRLLVPDEGSYEVGSELARRPQTRFVAATVGASNLVWVMNLRAAAELELLLAELRTQSKYPIRVLERSIVLTISKLHGRILDRDGRAVGHVPVDPWANSQFQSQSRGGGRRGTVA
jgi:DNA-binding Lrp family transcriptional regulator